MDYPRAIVISVAILSGAIVVAAKTSAQTDATASQFRMEAGYISGTAGWAWRLNTITGKMMFCIAGTGQTGNPPQSKQVGLCLPVPLSP